MESDGENEAIAAYKEYQRDNFKGIETLGDFVLPDFDREAYPKLDDVSALHAYIEDSREYVLRLKNAASLRQNHYDRFIRGKREEDPGHRHFREGLNDIVEDAEEKLQYWSQIYDSKFDTLVAVQERRQTNIRKYYDIPVVDSMPRKKKSKLVPPPLKMSRREIEKREKLKREAKSRNDKLKDKKDHKAIDDVIKSDLILNQKFEFGEGEIEADLADEAINLESLDDLFTLPVSKLRPRMVNFMDKSILFCDKMLVCGCDDPKVIERLVRAAVNFSIKWDRGLEKFADHTKFYLQIIEEMAAIGEFNFYPDVWTATVLDFCVEHLHTLKITNISRELKPVSSMLAIMCWRISEDQFVKHMRPKMASMSKRDFERMLLFYQHAPFGASIDIMISLANTKVEYARSLVQERNADLEEPKFNYNLMKRFESKTQLHFKITSLVIQEWREFKRGFVNVLQRK